MGMIEIPSSACLFRICLAIVPRAPIINEALITTAEPRARVSEVREPGGLVKSQSEPVFNCRYVFCLRPRRIMASLRAPLRRHRDSFTRPARQKSPGCERHALYRSALFMLRLRDADEAPERRRRAACVGWRDRSFVRAQESAANCDRVRER